MATRKMRTGKRGGRYYISKGRKVYPSKKAPAKRASGRKWPPRKVTAPLSNVRAPIDRVRAPID